MIHNIIVCAFRKICKKTKNKPTQNDIYYDVNKGKKYGIDPFFDLPYIKEVCERDAEEAAKNVRPYDKNDILIESDEEEKKESTGKSNDFFEL
jgi:hypothetical protein